MTMTRKQISKLARKCIKAGPCIAFDKNSNGYWAYVCFIRDGIRFDILIMDEDIVRLGSGLKYIEAEIRSALDCMKATPLNVPKHQVAV